MEAYHPLQLGHQETFSRVGVQGSNSRASVFEGISRAGWLLFLDLGKKVNGTSGKYVRNVFFALGTYCARGCSIWIYLLPNYPTNCPNIRLLDQSHCTRKDFWDP